MKKLDHLWIHYATPRNRKVVYILLTLAALAAADHTNWCYEQMARWQPQPIRSLLIDDCIDRGIEYHAGGARCCDAWSLQDQDGQGGHDHTDGPRLPVCENR